MSRFARRVDSSHRGVVNAFEFAGCSVLAISSTTTAGVPDLVVGISGRTILVEVKPDTKLKAHALRPSQVAWAAKWRGSPVHVVRSPAEAWELAALVRMAKEKP